MRTAIPEDQPFIVGLEHAPAFREYIGRWTNAEHAAAMRDPDTRYLIELDDAGKAVGYAILRGLQSEHRNIELKRIVMQSPGHGHGRKALQSILKEVFTSMARTGCGLMFSSRTFARSIYTAAWAFSKTASSGRPSFAMANTILFF